jgi:hypothetical protein
MDLRSILKCIKFGQLLPPETKDNGNFVGNTYFDTLGLVATLVLFNIGAGDIAIGSTAEGTPPYLEECDTYNGSYTAITGAALTAVIAADDDGKQCAIALDLTKSHKRYLAVNAPHSGDGTVGGILQITVLGFPSDQLPKNAAGMGLKEFIEA